MAEKQNGAKLSVSAYIPHCIRSCLTFSVSLSLSLSLNWGAHFARTEGKHGFYHKRCIICPVLNWRQKRGQNHTPSLHWAVIQRCEVTLHVLSISRRLRDADDVCVCVFAGGVYSFMSNVYSLKKVEFIKSLIYFVDSPTPSPTPSM